MVGRNAARRETAAVMSQVGLVSPRQSKGLAQLPVWKIWMKHADPSSADRSWVPARTGSFPLLNLCMKLLYAASPEQHPPCSTAALEEPETNGQQRQGGSESAFCPCKEQRGKGCSVWNFFLKRWFSKKGNKQSKETSPATACPPAKALFGQG